MDEFKASAADPTKGKEMMAMMSKSFDDILPKGQNTAGWEDMKKMQEKFNPMNDKIAGGHWIWEESSAKAAFEFSCSIFGTDGRFTKE